MGLLVTKKALLLLHAVAFLIFPAISSLLIDYKSFQPNMGGIKFEGDAYTAFGEVQLTQTMDPNYNVIYNRVGHLSLDQPVRLRDNATGTAADFSSEFDFNIVANDPIHGDGLAFFLAHYDFDIPGHSSGGMLGLLPEVTTMELSSRNQIVAIEIDRFQNDWDPSDSHVGINVKSLASVATANWTSSVDPDGLTVNGRANVTYDSKSKELKVAVSEIGRNTTNSASVSYEVDLGEVLPEQVRVGFSASTGSNVEQHVITSWRFYSSLGS